MAALCLFAQRELIGLVVRKPMGLDAFTRERRFKICTNSWTYTKWWQVVERIRWRQFNHRRYANLQSKSVQILHGKAMFQIKSIIFWGLGCGGTTFDCDVNTGFCTERPQVRGVTFSIFFENLEVKCLKSGAVLF